LTELKKAIMQSYDDLNKKSNLKKIQYLFLIYLKTETKTKHLNNLGIESKFSHHKYNEILLFTIKMDSMPNIKGI
jgi:hypothetical protein